MHIVCSVHTGMRRSSGTASNFIGQSGYQPWSGHSFLWQRRGLYCLRQLCIRLSHRCHNHTWRRGSAYHHHAELWNEIRFNGLHTVRTSLDCRKTGEIFSVGSSRINHWSVWSLSQLSKIIIVSTKSSSRSNRKASAWCISWPKIRITRMSSIFVNKLWIF